MPASSIKIRNVDIPRARLGGYRRQAVDELLDEIADSLAEVERERDQLAERLDALTAEDTKHRELETLLRSTLVSAERAAQDMKAQARRESDLIVQEAHAESRRVTREAAASKGYVEEEMIKIRAQLRAVLDALGEPAAKPAVQHDATPVEESPVIGEALEGGIRKVVG